MSHKELLPVVIGLLLGILGGLYYAWVINPVEYVDTAPVSLRQDFKADYLTLIAAAYTGTADLERAKARLALFPDANSGQTLGALAQQRLAEGRPESEARALAQLAAVLGERPTPLAQTPGHTIFPPSTQGPSPASSTPTLASTSTPSPTLAPTRTPTAMPGTAFQLLSRQKVCDSDLPGPLLQVLVLDATGNPVPGAEILVVWDAGQDHFFTGLKPELNLGYGDFTMSEGVTYTLQLGHGNEPITGLSAEDCLDQDQEPFLGSWLLTFQQPANP